MGSATMPFESGRSIQRPINDAGSICTMPRPFSNSNVAEPMCLGYVMMVESLFVVWMSCRFSHRLSSQPNYHIEHERSENVSMTMTGVSQHPVVEYNTMLVQLTVQSMPFPDHTQHTTFGDEGRLRLRLGSLIAALPFAPVLWKRVVMVRSKHSRTFL